MQKRKSRESDLTRLEIEGLLLELGGLKTRPVVAANYQELLKEYQALLGIKNPGVQKLDTLIKQLDRELSNENTHIRPFRC